MTSSRRILSCCAERIGRSSEWGEERTMLVLMIPLLLADDPQPTTHHHGRTTRARIVLFRQ